MEVDSKPEELDELDRRIMQLKIEREALKKETDKASKDRLQKLEKELVDLEEQSNDARPALAARRRRSSPAAQKIKEQLEQPALELEQAQRKGDLAKAGELAYGVIPELEAKLTGGRGEPKAPWSQEVVTPEHIAQIVSRWTGIPVDKMLEGEREKLLQMETQSSSAWWARTRRCMRCRPPCAAPAPACRTPTGRSARSCSWARPASARPSSPGRSPNSCSTTSTP